MQRTMFFRKFEAEKAQDKVHGTICAAQYVQHKVSSTTYKATKNSTKLAAKNTI